jgi:hypothetical protein
LLIGPHLFFAMIANPVAQGATLQLPPAGDGTVQCFSEGCVGLDTTSALLSFGGTGVLSFTALLEFDLSGVPAEAVVQSATLWLTPAAPFTSSQSFSAYEADGTITLFDYASPSFGNVTMYFQGSSTVSGDVKTFVDYCRARGVGLGFQAHQLLVLRQLAPSESTVLEARPYLEIEYSIPAPVPVASIGARVALVLALMLVGSVLVRAVPRTSTRSR